MKKIFYLIAALGITWSVISCDSEPKNPGDTSVAAELKVTEFVSANGQSFRIGIDSTKVVTLTTKVGVKDTTYDADGNQVITVDSVDVPRNHKTTYYYAEEVVLPPEQENYFLKINSNARWNSNTIRKSGANWLKTTGGISGGGDGEIGYETLENTTKTARPYPFTVNVFSSDTTVWYVLSFGQAAYEQN